MHLNAGTCGCTWMFWRYHILLDRDVKASSDLMSSGKGSRRLRIPTECELEATCFYAFFEFLDWIEAASCRQFIE
jgi:hypothetical protein